MSEGIYSVQPYIDYHRQPNTEFLTMREYCKLHKCMMYDPHVEQQIKEQHRVSHEYQEFDLERTDLLSKEERDEFYRT